jgi:long-chain acyl-CoA synthetase
MEETLPGLLTAHAERTPRGVALRQKRLGIWQEVTWAEYLAGAQAISLGLVGLGLKPGEVVALAGESRVPWLEAELGVQAAGGVAAPLSAHATHSVLADLLCTCGARFVIVEGRSRWTSS